MSAGRRNLFQQHSGEADFLQRFDKIMDDVISGRTPLEVAAAALNRHPRSLQRAIDQRKKERAASVTYAIVDKWTQMVEAQSFEKWVEGRFVGNWVKEANGRKLVADVQRLWEKVWKKKNLALLRREDILDAKVFISNLSNKQSTKRGYLLSLRALVRSGVGEYKWLSEILDTRGSKAPPRIPVELRTKETFVTVMPRLFHALLKLEADGFCTYDEAFTMRAAVIGPKNTIGIRTGDQRTQRELWGTKINNPNTDPSTSLIVNFETTPPRILHWTVFSKKGEMWEIPRAALETYPLMLQDLEDYIHKRGLKNGDWLVQDLSDDRAREIFTEMCKAAELSHYTLHDMRKVAATRAILAGVHLEVVAQMGVGWKDIATLNTYYVTIKGVQAEEGYQLVKAYLNNGGRESGVK